MKPTIDADILRPNAHENNDSAFYETYDNRKKRIAAEKLQKELAPKPKYIGRPRVITGDLEAAIIREYGFSANKTDVARKFGIDRRSVLRVLKRRDLPTNLVIKPVIHNDFIDVRVRIDKLLHNQIKRASKLRKRSINAEIRAALRKEYD